MLPAPPKRLSLANLPTELRPLDRISKEIGGPRLWLKCDDQTGSLVSGNKIRKLEFLLAEAQIKGCNTVLTCGGLQSNHCRATAAVAARLGMRCHLILRGPKRLVERDTPYALAEVCEGKGLEGNVLLDVLCGAEVSVFSPQYYFRQLDSIFNSLSQEYAHKGEQTYSIPTGGSNALGLWGYIQAARELTSDFSRENIDPAVVCATGSGGTQGGLSLGFHLLNDTRKIFGMAVCDSNEYFDNKIREDVRGWQKCFLPHQATLAEEINVDTIDHYIGPGYALGYPELFECIEWLAKTEGVVLDPVYTGKAFYGMVCEIKNGNFSFVDDIVFVHTGGIYGLFPFNLDFRQSV